MRRSPVVLRSTWAIHGLDVGVCSEDPAVLAAIELRFRAFRPSASTDSAVRFEFVLAGSDPVAPPLAEGRPVYDTPYGSVYYHPDADVLQGELAGVSLRCEPARGTAVLRSEAFRGTALYLATHPLTTIALMELLERRGLFSLHAACLCNEGNHGVLLAGASGAGKSTLALTLARGGMGFLSDDVVFLAPGETGAIRALGFSDTVGVSEFAARNFGELRGRLAWPPDGFPKPLGRIEDLCDAPVLAGCQPRALVFPEVVTGGASEIIPFDPREALLRLVPDVLLTEPSATQAHLEAIAALLSQVDCYRLFSGADLERTAALVRELV